MKIKNPLSFTFNEDCVLGMKKYSDSYFDYAIVDIEYGIGASKPTKKPNYVAQKNGSKNYINNNNYEHTEWDFVKSSLGVKKT